MLLKIHIATSISSCCEEEQVDFRLVSTYTPAIFIVLRMCILFIVVEFSRLGLLSMQIDPDYVTMTWVPVLVLCLVLWDSYLMQGCVFSCCVCGVAVIGVSVLNSHLQKHNGVQCKTLAATSSALVVDAIWGFGSCVFLACLLTRLRLSHQRVGFMLFDTACFVAHILSSCVSVLPEQYPFRSALFAATGLLLFHARARVSGMDRNTHRMAVLHVSVHLMFVNVIVVVASAVFCVGLFARVYLQTQAPALSVAVPPTVRKTSPSSPTSDDTLAELRRAQGRV